MPTVDIESHDEEVSNKIKYDDVDLTEYDDEELLALGLSYEDIKEIRGEEDEEESEDEDEESEEEPKEEEEEVEEEEEKPKKEPRIPKSRFDEAVNKEREKAIRAEERAKYLEERIEQLLALQEKVTKEEKPVEPEFDFDAAEDKYAELLLEGEVKEAANLRRQMEREREKRVAKLLESVKEEAKKASKDLSVAEKKELVIQEALSKYSFLDSESEDYDADLVEEINFIAVGYEVNKKMPSNEALQKAIDRVVKREAKPTTPKVDKTERTAKKKQAMKTQPPDTTSSKSVKEKQSTEFDWENMSQKEFSELYRKSPKLVEEALRKTYS